MTVPADRCPDCQVSTGVPHEDGCDVARCLRFGEQRLMHEMSGGRPVVIGLGDGQFAFATPGDVHDCGRDVWAGEWPGVAECWEFGWWAYFVPNGDPSWRQCGPDDPGAVPDLNRLARDARWDAPAGRWQRREPAEVAGA